MFLDTIDNNVMDYFVNVLVTDSLTKACVFLSSLRN